MDVLTIYTSTTAIWLSLQSITLFLFPRLILDLLSTNNTINNNNNNYYRQQFGGTATETYLTQLLAVALFILTIVALYFTYFPPPPAYSSVDISSSSSSGYNKNNAGSSSSSAITHILTLFHTLTFIVIYTRYLHIVSVIPSASGSPGGSGAAAGGVDYEANTTGYILGAIGYAVCASLGIWVLVFGSSPSRLSKRTGADKRTSGWPFTNEKAYDKKKDRKMG